MVAAKLKALSVEELANTLTHGLGLFLSIIGFAVLLVLASFRGTTLDIASCVVYGSSLVILYSASTFYHGANSPTLKKRLQIVDHCCIYLLIAGSYTPFVMTIGGPLGRTLLAFVWIFACIGITAKLLLGARFPVVSVISYLLMGWVGVFAIEPLFEAIGLVPIGLIIAGGLAYSLGVIFFAWKSIRHHHAIFHVFVLLGSFFHYAAVVGYVIPFSAGLYSQGG
jgi:hemolysin III